MTKDELYQQILQVRSQLSDARADRKRLEEKWDVLLEFGNKCNERAEAFLNSISRRKRKLSGVDQLLSRMKAAMKYRERMNDLLTGSDYLSAKRSVDEMMDNLQTQKRKLRSQLEDAEYRIRSLNNRLYQLECEYDQFPEEVEADG